MMYRIMRWNPKQILQVLVRGGTNHLAVMLASLAVVSTWVCIAYRAARERGSSGEQRGVPVPGGVDWMV